MKNPVTSWIGTAVLALALLPAASVFGQGRAPKPPQGPAPMLNGHPDLSGLWQRPYVPDMSVTTRNGDQIADPSLPDVKADPNAQAAGRKGPPGPPRKELPFSPEGERIWKSYDPAKGDYTGSCLPFGLIRSMNSPDPIQIMQSNTYVSLLYEQNTWFKVFPVDGRKHRDIVATWFGDSVGRWDGDTLVVDTINFNGKTRLDTIGHPHSDQLHVVEHFTRKDAGHIGYEITIDDPKYYTRPWKNTRTFTLRPDWEIMEYSCEENNKDFLEGHIKGGLNPDK